MADQPHYAMPSSIPLAEVGHITRKAFDLPYAGRSDAQKLDIYWPEAGNGPFPVIISIHGGAFMGGDKRDIQLAPMLEGLQRGYAVVGINYRMSGEARFPALVHDVKAAVRWIRANAQRYLLDAQRIAAWGGSAGGYLALMAGVTAGVADLEDLSLGNAQYPDNVQVVVDWFGPTDFLKMDEQLAESGLAAGEAFGHNGANSPESLLLGEQITRVPELVRAANPETYIPAMIRNVPAPSFFIQHGDRDDTVPHQQSLNLAARLVEALGPEKVTLEILKGARHADPQFSSQDNVNKVLDFLDRHMP